jgi:FAD/FMN-containing dehydrogenase
VTGPLAMTGHDPNQAALRHWLLNMTDHGAYGAGGRALSVAVRGDGAFVELTDGGRYIDALSSMFCNQLGYAYAGERAAAYGGTISAEHGIGAAKPHLLHLCRWPDAISTMQALKSALDPDGLLNPGKLFQASARS